MEVGEKGSGRTGKENKCAMQVGEERSEGHSDGGGGGGGGMMEVRDGRGGRVVHGGLGARPRVRGGVKSSRRGDKAEERGGRVGGCEERLVSV